MKDTFSPFKTRIEAARLAYKDKRALWEKDKDGIKKDVGYDRDFEEVLDFLIEHSDLKGKTLGEFLGYSKEETRGLFDLWGGLYPEYRKQERVRMLDEYKRNNPAPSPIEKEKRGRSKDPYNAKVKTRFFEVAIHRFDSVVINSHYQNNDEKFGAYSKAMQESLGLTLAAGTMENNWGKKLTSKEKSQVVKLLKEYKQDDLAVKFSLE